MIDRGSHFHWARCTYCILQHCSLSPPNPFGPDQNCNIALVCTILIVVDAPLLLGARSQAMGEALFLESLNQSPTLSRHKLRHSSRLLEPPFEREIRASAEAQGCFGAAWLCWSLQTTGYQAHFANRQLFAARHDLLLPSHCESSDCVTPGLSVHDLNRLGPVLECKGYQPIGDHWY